MASKVPYYYSELKKESAVVSEKNNLNRIENVYEKSHGFDNPLLAIEPDVATCEIPERSSTCQKKKKKKKSLVTPIYRRSNSLTTNGIQISPHSSNIRREVVSVSEATVSMFQKNNGKCHRRRSSEPNIYEEIPELLQEDPSYYSGSVYGVTVTSKIQNKKSSGVERDSNNCTELLLDEVEKVQQRHTKILKNLNLDVEAMLMPADTCSDELLPETNEKIEPCIESKSLSPVYSLSTAPYFANAHWQNSCAIKSEAASLSHRVMNEYILQQSDFGPCLKDDGMHKNHKSYYTHEDNIYEEVDVHQFYHADEFDQERNLSEFEMNIYHSGSSANNENDGSPASKFAARFIGKKKSSKKFKDHESVSGGFTRWFSTRKKDYELFNSINKTNKQFQVICADEEGYVDVKIPKKQRPPLSLPPMPSDLSSEKVKRRYIVGTIVDSENSYVNSLQRLIRDYKRPLEDSVPSIISVNKVSIMFYRLEQILQCHNIFGIALTQCVRQWDQEEKIGDVFVKSFSKAMVLDIYSEFINNFSVAMETAKQASKNKSAFSDFLKAKQVNSSDRLSFFGLMVKPVQRFPQFILLLQDLLKHTPSGHHDRMSLQLALTCLETLADTLNERKREAEQHRALQEVLKHLRKFSLKSLTDQDHYLLRQDDVAQLQFDHTGLVVKAKERRLFLLNDLLVAVSVTQRYADGMQASERLNLKWAVPLQDIEVQEDTTSATRNLLGSPGRIWNYGIRSNERNSECDTVQALCNELSDLVHDLEVTSRITALVATLRRSYNGINLSILENISHSIQESIRQKDEEIMLLDNCCLQLSIPIKLKASKESMCFQMQDPAIKREWSTELRMAKLALDANNTPAWDVSEYEKPVRSRVPLFVKTFSVYQSLCFSEVKCGCQYTVYTCSIPQQYLWLCSSDSVDSHLVVMAVHSTHLQQVAVYHLSETQILSMEAAPASSVIKSFGLSKEVINDTEQCAQSMETVWMSTNDQKILVLKGFCPEKWEEVGTANVAACVVQIKYHLEQMFIALSNGTINVFRRDTDGQWQFCNPSVITLDQEPVSCLLPLGLVMYCACGKKIWLFNVLTCEIQRNYAIQHEVEDHAFLLAHSGMGLWIALKNSATICLYHAETFHHLQDINVTASVSRILASNDKPVNAVTVTSLLAIKGLLWVGTNVGIILNIPLPRLEGVPIITGRISLSFHAHQGPVTFLLSLQSKIMPMPHLQSPSKQSASINDSEDSITLQPRPQVVKQISDSKLLSPTYNKKYYGQRHDVGDVHESGVKTLPSSLAFCPFISSDDELEDSSNVYGLYADLMNVQDYEKNSQEKLYERLNHSDPELVHFHLNSLDRRLKEKSGRPRSWDLSAMTVSEDSDSSSAAYDTTSATASTVTTEISSTSQSVDSQGNKQSVQQILVNKTDAQKQITFGRKTVKPYKHGVDSSSKTMLMLTGGCGYINFKKPDKDNKSNSDAYVMIWEVKL